MRSLVIFLFLFNSTALPCADRFPAPTEVQVQEGEQAIEQLAKTELFGLPRMKLIKFLIDRYWLGPNRNFNYYQSNPLFLTSEQSTKPAILLLHAHSSNQGQWLPILQAFHEYNMQCPSTELQSGPIFTLNYTEATAQADLIAKIEEIKLRYLQMGVHHLNLYLVGHSLGAINAAKYAYSPDTWVEGTTVKKVVSIAGRLRNIEPPIATPYYPYCHCVLTSLDDLWQKIVEQPNLIQLYCIAAQNDWLIPMESVLVADQETHNFILPAAGHVLVARSGATAVQLIKWLINE